MKFSTLRFCLISLGSFVHPYKRISGFGYRHISKIPTIDQNNNQLQQQQNTPLTTLNCVGTELTPIKKDEANAAQDNDDSWKTKPNPKIVAVRRENFSTRPELITFDAFGTLIEPSQSIGRWYREALNIACDMKIRLPRPALFTAAFKKAYKKRMEEHPCFGATTGLTPEQWWYEVIKQTYLTTERLVNIDPEEINQLMPAVFQFLFYEIFNTKKGWSVKEDALYTLEKLRDWRDKGAGPKLGVISNFDNRLPAILEDVGIKKYFDFILTSYDAKTAKPDSALFSTAIKSAATVKNTAACYHVGDSIDIDVSGAVKVGWTAIRINEQFDAEFPDWFDIDTEEQASRGQERRMELMNWGRKNVTTGEEWVEIWGLDDILQLFGFPQDLNKPIATTYVRNFYDDE